MAVLMDLEWIATGRQFSPTQLSGLRVSDGWTEMDQFYTRIRPTVEDDCTGTEMGLTGGRLPDFTNASTVLEAMTAFEKWLQPDDVMLWWNTNNAVVFARIWRYAFGKEMPAFGIMRDAIRNNWPKGIGKAPKDMIGQARTTTLGALLPEHHALHDTENFRRILSFTGVPFSQYQAQGCMHEITEFAGRKIDNSPKIAWRGPVYMTRGSHAHIVHTRGCTHLKNKPKSELTMIPNIQAAQRNGGDLCRHCLSIHRFYRKEQQDVDAFAVEHRFTLGIEADSVLIHSRRDQWRIALDEYTGGLALYHQNASRLPRAAEPERFPGFHRQKLRPKTIRECLEYIVRHDAFRIREDRKQAKLNKFRNEMSMKGAHDHGHHLKSKQPGWKAKQRREALREEAAWEEAYG